MEPISHAITGISISLLKKNLQERFWKDKLLLGVIFACTLSAISPDLDLLLLIYDEKTYFIFHRGFTHSLFGLAVLAVGIAALTRLLFRKDLSFLQALFWSIIGISTHEIIDLLNSYGAQALWPFNGVLYSKHLFTLLDPIYLGFLIIGLMVCLTKRGRLARRKIMLTSLGFVLLYSLIRLFIANSSEDLVRKHYESAVFKENQVSIAPTWLGINKWKYVVDTAGRFITGEIKYSEHKVNQKHVLMKEKVNPYSKIANKTELVTFLNRFTNYLYHKTYYLKNQVLVRYFDLRFGYDKYVISADIVIDKKTKQVIYAGMKPYNKE